MRRKQERFEQHGKLGDEFEAPCLPVTGEESLQALAGRTLKDYKNGPLLQSHIPSKDASMPGALEIIIVGIIGRVVIGLTVAFIVRQYGPFPY